MTVYELYLKPYPTKSTFVLDNKTIIVSTQYSPIASRWLISVRCDELSLNISNVPIIVGVDMLEQYTVNNQIGMVYMSDTHITKSNFMTEGYMLLVLA